MCEAASAAPSAPPASPAAGCIQMRSKIPSRSSRPFATQLRATPPAMHSWREPVISRVCRGELQDRLLGHLLDRGREVHLAPRDPALGLARRPLEEVVKALVGDDLAVQEAEVVEIQPVGAVRLEVDQHVADAVGVEGPAVGREAHQLVLPGVHLEAAEVGERAVQQPQRVGVVDLLQGPDLLALSAGDARRGPLADAVDGEDRGLGEWGGVERGCGVGEVVPGEEQRHLAAEGALQVARHEELDPQERRRGLEPLLFPARRHADQRLEHAVEAQHRVVVEHHGIELVWLDEGLLQAVADRVCRKTRVVLLSGEALLLRGGNDVAVPNDRGRGVVVEARDAKDRGGHAPARRASDFMMGSRQPASGPREQLVCRRRQVARRPRSDSRAAPRGATCWKSGSGSCTRTSGGRWNSSKRAR